MLDFSTVVLSKNTTRITNPLFSTKSGYRIPDVYGGLVGEVKNVATQGWTRQLNEYSLLAGKKGKPFVLEISQRTEVLPSLQNAMDKGLVEVIRGGF